MRIQLLRPDAEGRSGSSSALDGGGGYLDIPRNPTLSPRTSVAWAANYPQPQAGPQALWALDGNCGPLVAWSVLKHFRRRVSADEIIRRCRWSSQHGTFTIGMAVGLSELGLTVVMHSDPDPTPNALERKLYATARRLGIPIRPAVPLAVLLRHLSPQRIPVVFYDEIGGDGHFSPLFGVRRGALDLPYGNSRFSPRSFAHRWRTAGVCRQSLLVSCG